MTKRILAMLLTAALLLNSGALTAGAQAEAVKASALVYTVPGFTPLKDSYGVSYIRDHFGLDLDVLPVDIATKESWNIFWASDGYADIIVPYGINEALAILNEDICRPIDYAMVKEHAPRLHALLMQAYGSEEAVIKSLTYKGEIYCIPYFSMTGSISWVSAVRNDWLKKVGLSAPATLDELTAVLKAFTFDDPDGNGVNDTYGVNSVQYGLANVPAYFGTSADLAFWLSEDGSQVTSNAVSEEYRAFLRQVNEWYAAGYMDPEFITDVNDRAAVRSKFATGKMGIYCDNPWWFEEERGATNPLQMLCDTDATVDFATGFSIFGGLKNGEGEPAVLSGYSDIKGQGSVYFGYDCPDEVVLKVLDMINASVVLYDGSEEDKAPIRVKAEMDIGVEGENWKWNDAGTNVQPLSEMTPEYQNKMGTRLFPVAANLDLARFAGRKDAFVEEAYKLASGLNKVYRWSNFSKPSLTKEGADMYDLVSNYFYECENKFITGEMSLDNDWEAYVRQMEELGLSKVLAEYTAGAAN